MIQKLSVNIRFKLLKFLTFLLVVIAKILQEALYGILALPTSFIAR